jgi:hypothetical protein
MAKRKASQAKKGGTAGIRHVVHISTNVSTSCEHCDKSISSDFFDESVNHYIDKHGYKLLHVGQETTPDDQGKSWHSTVAVLGTERPVKPKKIRPIEIEVRESRRAAGDPAPDQENRAD